MGGDDLLQAIRTVSDGGTLLDPKATQRVVEWLSQGRSAQDPSQIPLSEPEEKVLQLVAEGATNERIGAKLGLREKTVRNYVSSILSKLRAAG